MTSWQVPAPAYGSFAVVSPDIVDLGTASKQVVADAVAAVAVRHHTVRFGTEVVEGQAAPTLLREAEGATLLVVGSRGHGALTGMLLGSVSEHCVTHATCPVVVVRHAATSSGASSAGAPSDATDPATGRLA